MCKLSDTLTTGRHKEPQHIHHQNHRNFVIVWTYLLYSTLICWCCKPTAAAQECNQTLWQALERQTTTYNSLLQLKTAQYGTVDYLNDTSRVATVFAPTDAAMLAALRQLAVPGATAENSPLLKVLTGNSSAYNAVALFNLLPGRSWDADALVNLGTADTAISFFTPGDFSMRFNYNASSRVSVTTSFGDHSRVVTSIPACNGYLHLLDALLLPANSSTVLPELDVEWEELAALTPQENCGQSWYDELQLLPAVFATLSILEGIAPGILNHLNNTPAGTTMFLPEAASAAVLAGTDAAKAIAADPESFLLYSSISHTFCPSELLLSGPALQTRLGTARNTLLPLLFYAKDSGLLDMTSPKEPAWAAPLLDTWTVCGSVIYLYSGIIDFHHVPEYGYPQPPMGYSLVNESDSVIPTCVYPLTQTVIPDLPYFLNQTRWMSDPLSTPPGTQRSPSTTPSPTSSSSSSSSLLPILLPCLLGGLLLGALLCLAFATGMWRRRRRKRRAAEAVKEQDSDESFASAYRYRADVNANTEDLMHQIVAAASGKGFAKQASWKDRKAGLYDSSTNGNSNGTSIGLAKTATLSSEDRAGSGDITPAHSWPTPSKDAESWELSPNELEFIVGSDGKPLRLGAGGCGEVYRGVRGGVQDVAIKVLSRKAPGAADAREALYQEIQVLKDLRDGNVVQFYGACVRDSNLMLVTEYMPAGDLRRALHGPDAQQYQWYNRGQFIALDIARGLSYLHSRRVVHLDLKSANILLACDGAAKIADMGLAQVVADTRELSGIMQGTYAWAAPELLANTKLTEKADCFSFGVILWELVTLDNPKRGRMRSVRAPEECPQLIADLIDACLAVGATDRPTAREAFQAIRSVLKGPRTVPECPRTLSASTSAADVTGSSGLDPNSAAVRSAATIFEVLAQQTTPAESLLTPSGRLGSLDGLEASTGPAGPGPPCSPTAQEPVLSSSYNMARQGASPRGHEGGATAVPIALSCAVNGVGERGPSKGPGTGEGSPSSPGAQQDVSFPRKGSNGVSRSSSAVSTTPPIPEGEVVREDKKPNGLLWNADNKFPSFGSSSSGHVAPGASPPRKSALMPPVKGRLHRTK